ncbi:hypothetical protein HHL17_06200 [Chitinophaga sp. G-6-1-13]|uniref:Uncharacterized protein n=1 Tax=Chitinophaga fulva TaxID=2728842 RepID=A0A848GE65_9BACT|nr:hypothetical protein [Chitinophaga fulva]NML36784.1 hypothetical protein [Chitinophaga fulva]
MKKIVLAIALFAVSMGAFATETKAKEAAPKVVEFSLNNTKATEKSTKTAAFSECFGFRDGCGSILLVYMSGGTSMQRYRAALRFAESQMDSNGCF